MTRLRRHSKTIPSEYDFSNKLRQLACQPDEIEPPRPGAAGGSGRRLPVTVSAV